MITIEPLGAGVSLAGQGQASNLDNAEYVYCVDRGGTDNLSRYIHITDSSGNNARSFAINPDTDGIVVRKQKSDKIFSTTAVGIGSSANTSVFFTRVGNPAFLYDTKY